MEVTTIQEFTKLLDRSRLLPEKKIGELHRQWELETAPVNRNLASFSDWMVAKEHLTPYQANALRHGQHTFVLDEYTLLDRIGMGRMAGVFRAVNTRGMPVAIKILPPSRARDAESLARFEREARLALRLNHPNVIRSYHAGEKSGLHYLAMEFLPGETLEQVLERRQKLPPAEALPLMAQAFDGLQHLHEQKMVHRDLKPDNLMLLPPAVPPNGDTTLGSAVKILDVGLGRGLFEETSGGTEQELTAAGALLGLPDYLAPEQAKDAHSVDIRADIYSLGCVLYQTLTGQVPFPEKNAVRMLMAHAAEQPRPLGDLLPGQGLEQLQPVIDWLMAKDPNQRASTPAEVATVLRAFSQQCSVSAPGATPPAGSSPAPFAAMTPFSFSPSESTATRVSRRKRRGANSAPWFILAVVLLVCGGALGVIYAVQNKMIVLQAPAAKAQAAVPGSVPAAAVPPSSNSDEKP